MLIIGKATIMLWKCLTIKVGNMDLLIFLFVAFFIIGIVLTWLVLGLMILVDKFREIMFKIIFCQRKSFMQVFTSKLWQAPWIF